MEQYAAEHSGRVDPERFLNCNRERGRMVQGAPVRDRKALLRAWEARERAPRPAAETRAPSVSSNGSACPGAVYSGPFPGF